MAFATGSVVILVLTLLTAGVHSQFVCVISCDSSANLIGLAGSPAECCLIPVAGGFEIPGDALSCQSCEDFTALQASIGITASPDIFTLGENANIVCTVSTPPSANAEVEVTWTGPDGTTAAAETITSPTASVILEFQPFEASDIGEYTCSAAVTSPQFPGVETIVQNTVTIDGPTSTRPVFITEDSTPVAGEPYTLTCTVTTTSSADIQWIGPDGQPISTGPGVDVGAPVAVGGTTTSTLSFSMLSIEDSGSYLCEYDDVTTPNSTTMTVIVGIPQPTIDIPTAAQPPVLGQPYEQTCTATVPDSLQGTVTTTWFGPDGTLLSSGIGNDSSSTTISFAEFQLSDNGEYICEITVDSQFLGRTLVSGVAFSTTAVTDNCQANNQTCDPNASCVDIPGGAQCVCNNGFTGTGLICADIAIDECVMDLDNCDSNAECINTPDSFECSCNDGYAGDGITCTDIDECELGVDNCDLNAQCENTDGSFTCECNSGFTGDGTLCCPSLRTKGKMRTKEKDKTKKGKSRKDRSAKKKKSKSGTDTSEIVVSDECTNVIENSKTKARGKSGKRS